MKRRKQNQYRPGRTRRDLTRSQQLARGPIDLPFLMLTLLLLGIGLIMLLSASSYAARYDRAAGYNAAEGIMGNPLFYFKKQALYAAFGIFVMMVVSRVNYQNMRWFSMPLLLGAVVLLVLVLTPLGVNANGAQRWLHIFLKFGPTFQPSEFAKIGVVMFFAAMLSKRKGGVPQFKKRWIQPFEAIRHFFFWSEMAELLPYGAILVVIAVLMMMEPHISGTILVMAAGAAILFAAGISLVWVALGAGVLAGGVYYMLVVVGYNSSRLGVWLDPWSDPAGKGYQTIQSLYAVASGGLTGLGFGMSRQKYLYLPEEQNDFIFAVIAEELGFIGAALIVILFALLVIRGYWLALHARDRFGSLLIVGIITLLAVQVFLNMAVVTNLIPNTGISLPFFSSGGTALVIQLAEMGIVLSVSRQIPAPKQG